MQSVSPIHTDLVLLGGGHSHVEVLRQFAMNTPPGVRVTLVSRDINTPYSGMLPGLIAGHYSHEQSHIDLRKLARHAGARVIQNAALSVDPDRRLLEFPNRPPLAYDLLSIDIGSAPNLSAIDGARWITPVKPVSVFWQKWQAVMADVASAREGVFNIVVIGGGAGGIELALSIEHKLASNAARHRAHGAFSITVISGDTLLRGHSDAVSRVLTEAMHGRGIRLITGTRVSRVSATAVELTDAEIIECQFAIGVTNAAAAGWLSDAQSNSLALTDDGFVRVNDHLQSVSHPSVFAAGDVAKMESADLPRSGVYAVRQGPPLAHNLRAAVTGGKFKPYKPQRRALAIISTGNRYAVASLGSWSVAGAWVWRWKDWIDRRWMHRYQSLAPMMSDAHVIDDMRCGGCAAKVSSHVLERALADIGRGHDDAIKIGVDGKDDAAVLAPPAGKWLVQSVDQFRSFIDDPYVFAMITTHHCINDVLAMGATPHSALASVTLPFAESGKNENDLTAIIAGIRRALGDSGATLIGGHTAEGAELSLGLSVNGLVEPANLRRKRGLRIGDALVLTKPIGTGVVIAADAEGAVPDRAYQDAIDTMSASNVDALAILQSFEPHALTDITGFGLAGHLLEMIADESVAVTIAMQSLPMLASSMPLFDQGYKSSLHAANESGNVVFVGGDHARHPMLYDPQTSGPLLAALDAQVAPAAVAALRAKGYRHAARIGHVVHSESDRYRILAVSSALASSDDAPGNTQVVSGASPTATVAGANPRTADLKA